MDEIEADTEQWKEKYFDQLDESERNEKQWSQTDELLRKTISRLTLAADGQGEQLDHCLQDLRNAVRDNMDSAQLRTKIDAMSKALVELDRQPAKAPTEEPEQTKSTAEKPAPGLLKRLFSKADDSPDHTDDGSAIANTDDAESARNVLLHLLEYMPLPEEFTARVESIRSAVLELQNEDSLADIAEQIATLVHEIRLQTQREKQELEAFLTQLGEQLQEVDNQLQGSETFYDQTVTSSKQLDSVVKTEISSIETSVREATNLNDLKSMVQSHVDIVLQHLEQHRTTEQQRYEEAKTVIAQMNERLHVMEDEASTLRSRVQEERVNALTDVLTGLPNRLAWDEHLQQECARHNRFGTPMVLQVWDIDHFKSINDSFGHMAGDKVLRTLAQVLAGGVRETDFVARFGGEEFVVLMTGSPLEDCMVVAEKLRSAIEATGFHFRNQAVIVTASCGLTEYADGEPVEQWFERADDVLYKAKQQGRNRCLQA